MGDMKVDLVEAYATACQTIGEGVVREKLLGVEIAKRDGQIASLIQMLLEAGVIKEASEIVEGAADASHGDGSRVGSNGSVPDPPPEG